MSSQPDSATGFSREVPKHDLSKLFDHGGAIAIPRLGPSASFPEHALIRSPPQADLELYRGGSRSGSHSITAKCLRASLVNPDDRELFRLSR
jgi:hypothetical protein